MVAAAALPMLAQQGPINPKQVALLRWYPANVTTIFIDSWIVPYGAAFDGANLWVADLSFNNGYDVTEIRPSDGALLGRFTIGTEPYGIAFDGADIWVANTSSNTVTKLRASDGTVLGTFVVGTGPYGVAFDGATVWTGNRTDSNGPNWSVSKL